MIKQLNSLHYSVLSVREKFVDTNNLIPQLSCALGDCEPKYSRRRSHKREGKYLISTKRNLLNLCTLVTTLGDVISLTESNENTPYPPRPALTSIDQCDKL